VTSLPGHWRLLMAHRRRPRPSARHRARCCRRCRASAAS
jgi:hypothetical protein